MHVPSYPVGTGRLKTDISYSASTHLDERRIKCLSAVSIIAPTHGPQKVPADPYWGR